MRAFAVFVMTCCLWAVAAPVHAIVIGQVDDFQSGLSQDWQGAVDDYPADSGPDGVGDTAMLADAQPRPKPPHLIVYNTSPRWLGDYTAAGVSKIIMDVRNPNDFDLTMWLGIAGPGDPVGIGGTGDTYVSSIGVPVPADDQWHCVTFDVTASDFTNYFGGDIVAALADVTQFRILHNPVQSFIGADVDASFFLDNVGAVPETAPGDTDFDGDVDFTDFNNLANNYTGSGGSGKGWCDGDFDGDTDVDFSDFNELANHYTGPLGGGKSTPEPFGITLLATGAVGFAAFALRRRRRASPFCGDC